MLFICSQLEILPFFYITRPRSQLLTHAIILPVKETNLAPESHLSALQSTSVDKYSGCESNTACPRRLRSTVESPLMNLIRGLWKQQASFSVTAHKTLYCPRGPLLSAPQRMASQLAFVLIMLQPSSHCAVRSIPQLERGPWGF